MTTDKAYPLMQLLSCLILLAVLRYKCYYSQTSPIYSLPLKRTTNVTTVFNNRPTDPNILIFKFVYKGRQ
jgi:hypothetical protein